MKLENVFLLVGCNTSAQASKMKGSNTKMKKTRNMVHIYSYSAPQKLWGPSNAQGITTTNTLEVDIPRIAFG
jgi:hypothetical protein